MEFGKKYFGQSLILGAAFLIGSQIAYADNGQLLTMQELDSVTAGAAEATAQASANSTGDRYIFAHTSTGTDTLFLTNGKIGVSVARGVARASAFGTDSGQDTSATATVSPDPTYSINRDFNRSSSTRGGRSSGLSTALSVGIYVY